MLLTAGAKKELAKRANALAKQSRSYGAPVLNGESSLESVCRWLQWNDPNGTHTVEQPREDGEGNYPDELSHNEESAWETLLEMVESNE